MFLVGVGFEIRLENIKLLAVEDLSFIFKGENKHEDVEFYNVLWDDEALLVNDIKFLDRTNYVTF